MDSHLNASIHAGTAEEILHAVADGTLDALEALRLLCGTNSAEARQFAEDYQASN